MVQAPDMATNHPDLPQTLALLSEMNVSAQHVASLVDSMIQKVRNGELTTDQGLSFLEMKYNMLLSYLIDLTYVILKKCSGEKIEGDPCIERLVEIRTVLEKIRPIDRKLKYQIDKLVKTAVTGVEAEDATKYKANTADFMNADAMNLEGSEESEEDDKPKVKGGTSKDVYVPPKMFSVHYKGDETAQEKNQKLLERNKKLALSSSIMQDLREEYLDTPVEIVQMNHAQQMLTKQQKEREEYEEEYMTRLPITKAEKHRNRQLTTVGTLGSEVVNFGPSTSNSTKRKRKQTSKSKGKRFKRKRYN